ncbi:MAG TPA: hypothetical protein DCE41_33105 [Cytophagales bacterium]|nr:hypothetical protein [Cytophagales bacterium]HAA21320.1 hypothetical protein [Cytophagales bacterium]HAP63777.1 hypothetical protein [Cytophagales bacterium]
MVQEVLVWLIFAAALAWLGYKFVWPKKKEEAGCAGGCSSCAVTPVLDVNRIEQELKQRKEFS